MKEGIAFLLMILINQFTFALDEEFTPDVAALYNVPLVVTCKAIPGDNHYYEIEIFNVLKNTSGVEIKTGDRLKMVVAAFSGFGMQGGNYASGHILYLRPLEHHNCWVTSSSSQQIYPLQKGKIPFTIYDKTFHLTVTEYRIMWREMYNNFDQENACSYAPRITKENYLKRGNHSEVVAYFYKWCRQACFMPEDEVTLPEPIIEHQGEDPIFDFCEGQPYFLEGNEIYHTYCQSAMPDSIMNNEYGIEGKMYVSVVVEKDSTLSNFTMLRSIHPAYDKATEDLIMNMPTVVPGTRNGKVERCVFRLPVLIRRNDRN